MALAEAAMAAAGGGWCSAMAAVGGGLCRALAAGPQGARRCRAPGAGRQAAGGGWLQGGRQCRPRAGELAAVLRRPQVASGWVGRGRRAAGSPGAPGHKIEDREVRNWTRVSRRAESKSAESRHGAWRDSVAPKHVARLRLATSSAASRVCQRGSLVMSKHVA